jgi:hypothetical protein
MEPNLYLNKCWRKKLKKYKFKKRKKKANPDESLKPWFISQTHNSWNSRLALNQKAQFSINLMLKDEIEKKLSI